MKVILFVLALLLSQGFAQDNNTSFEQGFWDRAADTNWLSPDTVLGSVNNDNANCAVASDDYTQFNGTHFVNNAWTNVTSCWSVSEAQACFDLLGSLDDKGFTKDENGTDYGDLLNVCQVREDSNGQKIYDFLISYNDDYQHDDDCTEQEINFIQVTSNSTSSGPDTRTRYNVPPATSNEPWAANGAHPNDVFWFNPTTQQILFSVDHEDLEPLWGCLYEETTDEGNDVYQWTCDIELNIFFAGEVQFTYEFQMISILDRTITDDLVVSVERNVVTGDCCENTLTIEGSLHFCSNYDCQDSTGQFDRLEDPATDYTATGGVKTVERREVFWVAHRIDTAEFQHYYLHPISIKIGPFVPLVHRWQQLNSTEVGGTVNTYTNLLVYELESFVALDSLTIVSIAKLDDLDAQNAGTFNDADTFSPLPGLAPSDDRRRRLAPPSGADQDEDYAVKATNTMTVGNVPEQSKTNNNNASILALGSALLALAVLL